MKGIVGQVRELENFFHLSEKNKKAQAYPRDGYAWVGGTTTIFSKEIVSPASRKPINTARLASRMKEVTSTLTR